jgi:hypothetical protein
MMTKHHIAGSILESVPRHDYLHLLEGNTPKKVVEFLGLSRSDISKAMRVEKDSVRFDRYMPKELEARLNEIANICELMAGYFGGDVKKTALWFHIKNPALGGVSPRDMIRFGRYKKLEKFIRNALAGINP